MSTILGANKDQFPTPSASYSHYAATQVNRDNTESRVSVCNGFTHKPLKTVDFATGWLHPADLCGVLMRSGQLSYCSLLTTDRSFAYNPGYEQNHPFDLDTLVALEYSNCRSSYDAA